MTEKISKGIVIKYLKEGLKEIQIGSYTELINNVLKKMVDAGLIEKPRTTNLIEYISIICRSDKELESLIVECYTYLITHGIIIPKPVTPRFGDSTAWDSYQLTEYGKEWADRDEEPIPEDPQGFLSFIKSNIPSIDDIILQYVNEALNTFNGRFYFASSVMIGASSEKLIYLLAEATKNATNDPSLETMFQELLDKRKLFQLLKLIEDTFKDLITQGNIPYSVHEGSTQYLVSLFDAIRVQRNEAVHPLAGKMSVKQLRLLLLSFPHVCKKAYAFLDWLNKNKF